MKTAVVLTGPLGLDREMMACCCGGLLEESGWRSRQLDSVSLLGPWSGGAGERLLNVWSLSPAYTTGCISPICGPGAGWPTVWTGRHGPDWYPRCKPN
jgi:hypothetical protein